MATIGQIANIVFHSWQGVVIVLGVIFILVTQSAWIEVISRLSLYFKRKDLMVSTAREQVQPDVAQTEDFAKIQATLSDLNINADKEFKDFLFSVKHHLLTRNITKQEVRELIHSIFTIKEQYEFAYLNLFLVANSKVALQTLDHFGSATKKLFLAKLDLPEELANADSQKEVIFNALLSHHLIENLEGLFRVSEKGERFLRFMDLA